MILPRGSVPGVYATIELLRPLLTSAASSRAVAGVVVPVDKTADLPG